MEFDAIAAASYRITGVAWPATTEDLRGKAADLGKIRDPRGLDDEGARTVPLAGNLDLAEDNSMTAPPDCPAARPALGLIQPVDLAVRSLDAQRYRSLVEATSAIVWNTPESGEFESDQPGWSQFTGQSFEQLAGWGWINAIHREDRPNTARVWSHSVASRTFYQVEHRVRHHDGEFRHMSVRAVPILADDGSIREWIGVHTDITERKRSEEALRQSEERFRKAFDSAAIGMALVAPDGRWLRVNQAVCAIVGLTEEEVLATTDRQITHPADVEAGTELDRRLLAGEIPHYQSEKRYIHKAGHAVWVRMGVSLVRDAEGRPVHLVSQVEDITPRKLAEGAIRERANLAELGSEIGVTLAQRAPLREILQRCAECLVRHLDVAFARIWTLEPGDDVLTLKASAGMYTHLDGPHGRVPVGRLKIGAIARDRRPHLTNRVIGDPRLSDQDWAAREGMVAFAGYPLVGDDRVLGVVAAFARRPLSEYALQAMESVADGIALAIERKQAEGRLAYQATHDGLTGLPNRTLLLRSIERGLSSGRGEGARCALLLLDLDRFKEINDTFGHHYGDEVLKQLRPRLLAEVREADVVARLGGDEFGILLAEADESRALLVAGRILAALTRPISVDGHALDLGGSIGIALSPDHGIDAAALLQGADVAMYAAKRGRLGRAVYSPELSDRNPRRLALIGELRQGIDGDQLMLHYQPKVDLKTMRVEGAEALVRWQHPLEGLIPPGRFIPLAEETGLIRPLTLWTLREAIQQCRSWHRAGLDLTIAVNLSPENLRDERVLAMIEGLLEITVALPRWLTLEVTETAMMDNPARARKILLKLHEMGVRISIDDFGTGYFSLALLKELPVDEVKIDRSFVKDMMTNSRDSSIVRAVIDLGHNLGLKVVAEGVEDGASLRQLAWWGCDMAQGFYLSRPLDAPQFLGWVADARAKTPDSPGPHSEVIPLLRRLERFPVDCSG